MIRTCQFLLYADDTVLLVVNESAMREMLKRLKEVTESVDLKGKLYSISYLGRIFTNNARFGREIERRVNAGRKASKARRRR